MVVEGDLKLDAAGSLYIYGRAKSGGWGYVSGSQRITFWINIK